MNVRFFAAPAAGDVVLCRVPDQDPKKLGTSAVHPAFVLRVIEPSEPNRGVTVVVVPGSSNRSRLFDGDVEICRATHPVEFARSGLRTDTRFKMSNQLTMPYSTEWFVVPLYPEFGRSPKVGSLHPDTIKRVEKALRIWNASPHNRKNEGSVKTQDFTPRSVR